MRSLRIIKASLYCRTPPRVLRNNSEYSKVGTFFTELFRNTKKVSASTCAWGRSQTHESLERRGTRYTGAVPKNPEDYKNASPQIADFPVYSPDLFFVLFLICMILVANRGICPIFVALSITFGVELFFYNKPYIKWSISHSTSIGTAQMLLATALSWNDDTLQFI